MAPGPRLADRPHDRVLGLAEHSSEGGRGHGADGAGEVRRAGRNRVGDPDVRLRGARAVVGDHQRIGDHVPRPRGSVVAFDLRQCDVGPDELRRSPRPVGPPGVDGAPLDLVGEDGWRPRGDVHREADGQDLIRVQGARAEGPGQAGSVRRTGVVRQRVAVDDRGVARSLDEIRVGDERAAGDVGEAGGQEIRDGEATKWLEGERLEVEGESGLAAAPRHHGRGDVLADDEDGIQESLGQRIDRVAGVLDVVRARGLVCVLPVRHRDRLPADSDDPRPGVAVVGVVVDAEDLERVDEIQAVREAEAVRDRFRRSSRSPGRCRVGRRSSGR